MDYTPNSVETIQNSDNVTMTTRFSSVNTARRLTDFSRVERNNLFLDRIRLGFPLELRDTAVWLFGSEQSPR